MHKYRFYYTNCTCWDSFFIWNFSSIFLTCITFVSFYSPNWSVFTPLMSISIIKFFPFYFRCSFSWHFLHHDSLFSFFFLSFFNLICIKVRCFKWTQVKWKKRERKKCLWFFLYILFLPLTPISFNSTQTHHTVMPSCSFLLSIWMFFSSSVHASILPRHIHAFPHPYRSVSEHNIRQRQFPIEQYRIFKFININRSIQNGAEPRNRVVAPVKVVVASSNNSRPNARLFIFV